MFGLPTFFFFILDPAAWVWFCSSCHCLKLKLVGNNLPPEVVSPQAEAARKILLDLSYRLITKNYRTQTQKVLLIVTLKRLRNVWGLTLQMVKKTTNTSAATTVLQPKKWRRNQWNNVCCETSLPVYTVQSQPATTQRNMKTTVCSHCPSTPSSELLLSPNRQRWNGLTRVTPIYNLIHLLPREWNWDREEE